MPAIDINPWMQELLGQLSHNRQRQLVVLQGPEPWCDEQFDALRLLNLPLLVLSNRQLGEGPVPFSKAAGCLGSEARLVILDLLTGFNPDLLCIAAGLVQAGGVLVVFSTSAEDWQSSGDQYSIWQEGSQSQAPRFSDYFFSQLEADNETGLVITPASLPGSITNLPELQPVLFEQGLTAEQANCLQLVEQWFERKRPGVVLIRAQRGRGKSSCLGMLVQRLQTDYRVLVCADSRQNAAALLFRAPQAEFIAADRLLLENPPADLVVIDEAAMIPQSQLQQINRLYPRLVMATTTGGYEGTGQGFMLRFVALLESQSLLQLELDDPVRWCRGDRLESWLDQVLMQNIDAGEAIPDSTDSTCWQLQVLEDPGAAEFSDCLSQVYRLLVTAHYRTRPSDLRMLMENPDLLLVIARSNDRIVGAALLNREGGFDANLCDQIFLGQRRPKGHLLAQMLTAQAGIDHFAGYRGLRVQRIAVGELYRRRGLGTCLLKRALEYAQSSGLDYLGASFALDAPVTRFWQQAGFSLVHISYAQGKSSGNHSLAVLRSLKPQVDKDVLALQHRLEQQLPVWLTQFLQGLDSRQTTALLRFADLRITLTALERREIEAFAHGHKGFELCFVSLQKFMLQQVVASDAIFDDLLIEKAIQNRAWKRLGRESASDGRKQLQKRLRGLVEARLKA